MGAQTTRDEESSKSVRLLSLPRMRIVFEIYMTDYYHRRVVSAALSTVLRQPRDFASRLSFDFGGHSVSCSTKRRSEEKCVFDRDHKKHGRTSYSRSGRLSFDTLITQPRISLDNHGYKSYFIGAEESVVCVGELPIIVTSHQTRHHD